MRTENIFIHHIHKASLALACLAGLSMASCADDSTEHSADGGDRGTAVSFTVADAQDEAEQDAAKTVAGHMTRAAFNGIPAGQGVEPEDLISQKLEVRGAEGNALCLIETTVPGVNPVQKDGAQTRANISTAITDRFTSIGYRGAAPSEVAAVGARPWFHNRETNADGTLVNTALWSWEMPYGKFYGIYPRIDSYHKIGLSEESYTATPYVDFEAETDVKKQKDLMTACSGTVHYATRFVAPKTGLRFRHALTAVRFKVGRNLSWDKKINKVEIIGAMSKGRYTMSEDETGAGAAWTNLSTPATFTLGGISVSTSQAVNRILMGNAGDNYTFYMIPQPLSGVSVKIHFADGSAPVSVNLSGTWKPGTTKTYALSQNISTWDYQLTVTNPATAAYTEATAEGYTVQSYRTDPATGTQQPVEWKVVGYQESTDGGATFGAETDTKPAWLTALSLEKGNGGTAAQTGRATITRNITDHMAAYNQVMQEAAQKGSAGNRYNLSNSTGAPAMENTANSYLISAPGYYRIPLVYGNAIKEGRNNPSAYQTYNTGTYVLKTFKDHAGNEIASPYINVQNSADPATQAGIVWTDQSGIVDGLSVTNNGAYSYINFHVPADRIRNGNAVIAVRNASGTIMWSWHLWFDHRDVLNTVPVVNRQGYTYNFTGQTLGFAYRRWEGSTYDRPRVARVKVEQTVANRGAKQYAYIDITQNPGGVKEISSTLYQFGRKDAMPGVQNVSDGAFNANGGNNMSIQNGIQNPGIFYIWGSSWYNNPPVGYSYYNLWSMNNTTIGFNDNAVVKTVYDPCPAGFKMPASNAFTGFTATGKNSQTQSEWNVSGNWDMGWKFKAGGSSTNTVFFPATGYYRDNDGDLRIVGRAGYYWSAVPNYSDSGCILYLTQKFINPQNQYAISYGFSVRPVSE